MTDLVKEKSVACIVCGTRATVTDSDALERAGWRLQLHPVHEWECPGCTEPHEDEIRNSELEWLIDMNEVTP